MKKETYKGLEEEKLRLVKLDDFIRMTTSRNRRTLLRLNSNPRLKRFMERVRNLQVAHPKKTIRTHLREAIILPEWVGLSFAVHNGKEFKPMVITHAHVGHRLGEFSHSTGRVLHSGPGVGATRGSKFVPLK